MVKHVLYDGNNIAMASAYTGGEMQNSNGVLTGGLYNFLRTVHSLQKQMNADHISVAWDAANPWRKDLLPTYKESRKKENLPEIEAWWQAFNYQRGEMKRMSAALGFTHITAPRQEADDIAGHIVQKLKPEDELVLVTNDGDWFQLVRENVTVYRPRTKDWVTLENFSEVTSCDSPEQFLLAKAIVGDDGDDIPGVPGVGFITAVKFLRGQMSSGKKFTDIVNWCNNPNGRELTYKLVNLRKEIPNYDEFAEVFSNPKNIQDFLGACKEYQFGSIIKDINTWQTTFGV